MAADGLHPQGLAPEGLASEGLAPERLAPEGLAPEGLAPERLTAEGRSLLICAPFRRDAESIVQVLSPWNLRCRIFPDLPALAACIGEDVGVVLLTEESLEPGHAALHRALAHQPDWSDVPVLLLATQRHARSRATEAARAALWSLFANAIVLERPLSLKSLTSAVASCMRSRRRQFEMRDRLAERDRARTELAESEGRLRLATQAAEIGFWDLDPQANTLVWPPIVKRMFGLPPDAGVTMDDFYNALHPEDRDATIAAFVAACDPLRRLVYDVEYRTVGLADGVLRWVAAKGRGMFDDQGTCTRVIGTAIDITARKADEQALLSLTETLEDRVSERTDRLMAAEAALRQSQKMEAVGQLTGGIAHDFNNMLTGIMGALDIMRRRIATGRLNDIERFMDVASTSAQRAATLVARLLAFSRRQSLDARSLDVNALVRSLEDLLQRTLRENITLSFDLSPHPIFALADANQLESALLNLTINARDAMPHGGRLTVRTASVTLHEAELAATPDLAISPDLEPGPYIRIDIADTGSGMSPDLVEKVFEPFFTTKPLGQGTGLGLSMVYGFARQSGGEVRLESTPGEGTLVRLFLKATTAPSATLSPPAMTIPEGSGEPVLVVEDDASVRLLIREVLAELSYISVEAEDAPSALRILHSDHPLRLMISDVGLPGMNGRQLAELARTKRPDLPILLVTGYAENALDRAEFLGTTLAMITKPFALTDLAAKISQMLGVGADAAE